MKKKDNIFKKKKIENRLNLAQEDVHNILHVKKTIFLKRRRLKLD